MVIKIKDKWMDWLTIFSKVGGISAIVGYFKRRSSKKKATEEARKKHYAEQEAQLNLLKHALKGLEHHEIFQSCNSYLERGWVTSDDLEDLDYLYKPYQALKGNGTGKLLYKKVHELPIKNFGGK